MCECQFVDPNQCRIECLFGLLAPAFANFVNMETAHEDLTENWYLGGVCGRAIVGFDISLIITFIISMSNQQEDDSLGA